ncbi:hypothetical protein [Streptomyces pseudogriseolus]|uniref:hypothetical protein n=1 Tax=Streptomyces pseudogriseolus TaxID=36817 RepID=UPI003FA1B1FA
MERLTVRTFRRPRGGDGDVPKGWDITELDDGGRQIRLEAAPDHLGRILRTFTNGKAPVGS